MAWTSLQNSLGSKPEVLAGRILRKVTPKSVTVWIATRVGAAVTLTVWDAQNVVRMEGRRRTVAI
jgi:hypothetical protein